MNLRITIAGKILPIFTLVFFASNATADSNWRGHVSLLSVNANGEKTLDRPNGKSVSTDIDAGVGLEVTATYKISRRYGVTASYFGGSEHEIELRQDFPDGTDFLTNDTFRFNAIAIGLTIDLIHDREFYIYVEPFLAYAVFDDVFLDSAGPPFDQEAPLHLDIENRFGFGAVVGLDWPLGEGGWSLHGNARVLVVGFDGTTFANTEFPDTSSSIGLDFNAMTLGLGIGYRF